MPKAAEAKKCLHGGAFFEGIGHDFSNLSHRHNIINADVLDAWFDPSPDVLQALEENLAWIVRTSPPTHAEGLLNTISTQRGVSIDNIVTGAGSSSLIFLALTHLLTQESKVLLLDPMYGEYAHVCQQVLGCQVESFPLLHETSFCMDTERLSRHVRDGAFDLVILVNPNSPTGQYTQGEELVHLCQESPNTFFWVDETYIEYVGSHQSLERFTSQVNNLIICKSMSKVYALSGLRVAYLCASPQLTVPLNMLSPPWSVSLPAQIAATLALQDTTYYQKKYEETHVARQLFATELSDLDINVIQGVANFLLMFLPNNGPTATELVAATVKTGVYLRDVSVMGKQLGTHAVRTAVKSVADNRKITAAIKNALLVAI